MDILTTWYIVQKDRGQRRQQTSLNTWSLSAVKEDLSRCLTRPQWMHRCHGRAGRPGFTENTTPSGSPVRLRGKRIIWDGTDGFYWRCDTILNCIEVRFTFRQIVRSWQDIWIRSGNILPGSGLETVISHWPSGSVLTLSSAALVINDKTSAGSRRLGCFFHSFITLSLRSKCSYQESAF